MEISKVHLRARWQWCAGRVRVFPLWEDAGRPRRRPAPPDLSVPLAESVREGRRVEQRFIEPVGAAPEGPEFEASWERERPGYHRRLRQQGKQPGSPFGGSTAAERVFRARREAREPGEAIPVAEARALRERKRVAPGFREGVGRRFEGRGPEGPGPAGMGSRLRDTVRFRPEGPGRSRRYRVRRSVEESESGGPAAAGVPAQGRVGRGSDREGGAGCGTGGVGPAVSGLSGSRGGGGGGVRRGGHSGVLLGAVG